MSRTLTALAIFCLCVSVADSTTTSQSGTVSSSVLNTTYDKILSGTNTTEYLSTTWAAVSDFSSNTVTFGPGSTNTTSYVYGIIKNYFFDITTVIVRSINATIAASGKDTTEAAVLNDTLVTADIPATSLLTAVGPGYLAILTKGTTIASGYDQVQVTIVSSSGTLTTTTLTSNTGTNTVEYTLGGIFYDPASGAFFVSYSAEVSSTYLYSLYVQGVTASTAAVYWASPLSIALVATANQLDNVQIGGDNYINAFNIYVVFKDETAGITYYSKTPKVTTTSSAGSATQLVADDVSAYPYKYYEPIAVWASSYTYGIACSLMYTASASATTTYSIQNFLNGSTSLTADAGLTNVSTGATPNLVWGWGLNTGYTLVAVWNSNSDNTYIFGTFYANGTVNTSAVTLASNLQGPVNTYEDVNGAEWIGWTDIDTSNNVIYNLYLAKLQGQLNPPSNSDSSSSSATPTSQSGAVNSSVLNTTYDKILSGTNTTEYLSTTWAAVKDDPLSYVTFGPGSTNTTSYVYGILTSSVYPIITSVIVRSINATIAASGKDTTEAAVLNDTLVTANVPAISFVTAVGPGYLAIAATGTPASGGYQQIQVAIVSSNGTLATTTLTSNTGTNTAEYTLGGIFYDPASGAFFVSYSAEVSSTYLYSLYVQGVTASTAAVYWASPLSIALVATANQPSRVQIGGDNYINASNIYVVFKDETAGITYYSKTPKATNTSSAGSATQLVADDLSVYPYKYYAPIAVWASSYTYGIACSLMYTASASATATYSIQNFLNGSTSLTADAGLTNVSSATPYLVWGWGLNTGYTLVTGWSLNSGGGITYIFGTFYANGTVNTSAVTLASNLQGPVNTYEDVNGAEWIGWTDIDTSNNVIYNLYLAELQGQLNSSTALNTFMAFIALCLAAVFAL